MGSSWGGGRGWWSQCQAGPGVLPVLIDCCCFTQIVLGSVQYLALAPEAEWTAVDETDACGNDKNPRRLKAGIIPNSYDTRNKSN